MPEEGMRVKLNITTVSNVTKACIELKANQLGAGVKQTC